ncbi:MAG: membrane protein insertase YidC [Candidatus Delongbacteria bacterium]|nr:membrane protein insertase YidC [Candidatus Delongbacteria bacterium]MBN2836945.1 membrane protein insertase YidC [Candidatus Delongbacteria bacterium]
MDKNTITAMILIAIVIIVSSLMNSNNENFEKQHEVVVEKTTPNVENQQITTPVDQVIATEDNVLFEEDTVFVETDLFIAKFSTRGAAVLSWELKNYKSREDVNNNINLLVEGTKNLLSEIKLTDGTILKNLNFSSNLKDIHISGEESKSINFTSRDNDGNIILEKNLTFYGNRYHFDYDISLPNLSNRIAENGIKISWPEGMNFTEVSGENLNSEDYFISSYTYDASGNLTEYSREEEITESKTIDWGATRTKYFETIIFADKPIFNNFKTIPSIGKVDYHAIKRSDIGFELGMKKIDKFKVYIGPMDYYEFKKYDKDFESTLNWGWDIVRPFSWVILNALKLFYPLIPNYGVVIILFSLVINALILPFNIKAFKSTLAMKKIQPYLKEVKEKFPGDLQRQQQETMALYKKHKVNPFGTCLPSLIPMPILYGFFIVFRSTIEFRSKGFMLWIDDLSLPEVFITLPFNIPLYGGHIGLLPIIMAVFTYLQTKDTITDQNQKMMIYMMPLMLLIFFNNFASGLILYYTIGTIFRYFQQLVTKRNLKVS